jgi:predicted nucleotidyltransferase
MARLSPQERLTLSELAEQVRQLFGDRLVQLSLFGSRARGEGRDDSDLDVLVKVSELTREDRRAIQDLAFDLGLRRGLVISPLLADADAWEAASPLGRTIAREGVPL